MISKKTFEAKPGYVNTIDKEGIGNVVDKEDINTVEVGEELGGNLVGDVTMVISHRPLMIPLSEK